MEQVRTYNRKKLLLMFLVIYTITMFLIGRLGYIMIGKGEYYSSKAQALHERERAIKAPRGRIYDRNGTVLAGNRPVCTISVIHSQITNPEEVIEVLSRELEVDAAELRTAVEKVSSRERIQSNVDKTVADKIRTYHLDGVMIDEDYKRYYPYNDMASKVLGFTGADNQGIVGLEVKYDSLLQGTDGYILTVTDANGIELKNTAEGRQEPVAGNDLHLTLDVNIQKYVQQEAEKALLAKEAIGVSVIVMNPKNGEIYAMVNAPEYNLNEPYTLNIEAELTDSQAKQDALNQMWRNFCINDTYEPGSIFKTVTATAAFEKGVLSVEDTFVCPGYRIVGDRRIRCHKTVGHGTETFRQGIMNSCNPVFMDVGARVGTTDMYHTYEQLGLMNRTGIDLPGEANSIMHKQEDVTDIDLAIMSFGQSFQITPMQLITAVSAIVNGGNLVTPHFGMYATDTDGNVIQTYEYPMETGVISSETSAIMRDLMESVVAEGSGKNGQVEGYRIAGKTATSEKLPRGNGKYIASFIGVAPADDPQVITLVLINEPVGIYYGGTIAAPVAAEIYENILPYLGIEAVYHAEEPLNAASD